MLNKTPLLHQSFGPPILLSFSLSLFFRLIPWSAEALWVHFLAWASKTFSRRCSAPSLHRRVPEASVNRASPMPGALLAFCINQGISASFSLLYFLISRLRTTRFWSIKGPQHVMFAFSPCTIIYYIYAVFPEPFENKLCVFEKNSNMNSNIAYYANLVSITFLLKSITQLSIITKFSSLLSV